MISVFCRIGVGEKNGELANLRVAKVKGIPL
jgi:hypothetical protein